jgi:hypothetical protein
VETKDMPTDTLKRFRQEAAKLGGADTKKRQGELLKKIRTSSAAVVSSVPETDVVSDMKRLAELLAELRASAEEFKDETEGLIATVLELADIAASAWAEMWEAALRDPNRDRTEKGEVLRWVLDDTRQRLLEILGWTQAYSGIIGRPLPRLDELEARAVEFPLWTRECLARWEMLDRPAPPLDPERIARAQGTYAQGEHEAVDDMLSRVQEGGPWVKE